MIRFTATILKFADQGEKTGWTYIEVPAVIAQKLKPGNKRSFRVRGKLDNQAITGISLLPMGDGHFIMALNATIRKAIGKRKGAQLSLQLEEDKKPYQLNAEFMECMQDEPGAIAFFESIPKSFQNYFSKWIESAKTEPTRTKRIAQSIAALSKKMNFSEMIRSQQKEHKL